MAKAWDGRFLNNESELMEKFNESISFDKRLYEEDIKGSIAYSKALKKIGILTEEEQLKIEKAFKQIKEEIERGEFDFSIKNEDIHMAIEKRLIEITGEIGAKIHTGRSRNDQVATDVRLYLKKEIVAIKKQLIELLEVILEKSKENIDVFLPGYTHLQQAQIVRYAHYLMVFFWQFYRDLDRLLFVEKIVDILPLGSGAIAGSAFELDRELLKEELGFKEISYNSIDAISDRDFISDFIFFAVQFSIHASRFAEDGIIFSSSEFGYYTLSDMYSTGSSMMPQKKNPDSLELIRGKAGRIIGNLNRILVIQKGLPYSYNKDLQEDKEPLFDTIDNLKLVIEVLKNVIKTLTINREKMKESINSFIYATDLADYLVKKGIPFRHSHKIIGQIVLYCEQNNKRLQDLTLNEYKNFSELFEEDIYKLFDPEVSTNLRNIKGGTGIESVQWQLKIAQEKLVYAKNNL